MDSSPLGSNQAISMSKRIKNTLNIYCEESTKYKNYNYSPEIYELFTRKKDPSPTHSKAINEESFEIEKREGKERPKGKNGYGISNLINSPVQRIGVKANAKNNEETIVITKFVNRHSDEEIAQKLKKGVNSMRLEKNNKYKIALNNSMPLAEDHKSTNEVQEIKNKRNKVLTDKNKDVQGKITAKAGAIVLEQQLNSNKINNMIKAYNNNNNKTKVDNGNENNVIDYSQLVRKLMNRND